MRYVKIAWIHNHSDEPVLLYSELDDERWEVRKVEFYRNGTAGYADNTREFGGSALGLEPLPALALFEAPEFEAAEISKEEFEEAWTRATFSQ